MKRVISLLLVVVICCTMLPYAYINASATSVSQYSPHVNIEYGYTTSVKCGTIRYIAQIPTHTNYFFWDYWPASGSLKNYSTPNVECGTACISMALSFVGVNKTPYDILKPYNGTTMFIDWGEADAVKYTYSNLETAFERYQNGNGKYSPPVIHLDKYSSAGHFVLLIGKIDSDTYQVLDPANQKLWEITINGNVATYNHPNGGAAKTDTIDRSGRSDDVHQWYNPNATPPLVTESYPSYCTVKVTSSSSNIKSLPCSVATDPNSETIETASKNDTYTAIGLYKNTAGNLWYKVKAKNGSTGYLYAGEAAFEKQLTDDVSVSGESAPTELKVGSSYSIKGTIAAQHQTITKVGAWVEDINGDYATGATEDVNTQSYKLGSSKVDKGVVFGDLTAGIYHYFIGAIVKTNYASDAKTVSSKSVTIDLYESEFKVVSNAACSHSYSSSVTTAATCASAGVRTYTCSKCGDSYPETIPATGNHSYGGWTTVTAASCTANGVQKKVCSVCGDTQTQSVSATGHRYEQWYTQTPGNCTTGEIQKTNCVYCGMMETQILPAIGHNYQSQVIGATCSEPEKIRYTCQNCGDSYDEFLGDSYSDWSTSKPTGIDESLIETKTQYRYADYETTTSYEPSLSDYELIGSTWEQSGTGYADCVKSWPSGYLTSHSLYSKYNKTQKSNSESATDKTVVTSDQIVGYLYYHWCRGTYTNGPINRKISEVQTSTFCAFHSFYSTVNPSTLTADTDYSYVYANGDCCKDSHWYFCVPVYRQYYDTYRNLFTFGIWGGWSEWSDTTCSASATRKVETRILYRYVNTLFNEHSWNDGICSVCGEKNTGSIGMVGKWNIKLEDSPQMNYYLLINEKTTEPRVCITVGNEKTVFYVSQLEKDALGYYVASVEITPTQMNDKVFVQILDGASSSEVYTYTVRQYCDTILADEAQSQYHALVKEMLNYGAAAQMYFDYNTGNLANDGITDVAPEKVPETAEKQSVCGIVEGISVYGASLVYRDRIAVRYYFTGDVTGCTFTANGNTYTPVAKDGMHYVEIPDILPQDLDQQIALTVTDASGNTLTVTYGPMNYIVRMNEKGSAELKNLMKALYNYHLAAKAI